MKKVHNINVTSRSVDYDNKELSLCCSCISDLQFSFKNQALSVINQRFCIFENIFVQIILKNHVDEIQIE